MQMQMQPQSDLHFASLLKTKPHYEKELQFGEVGRKNKKLVCAALRIAALFPLFRGGTALSV